MTESIDKNPRKNIKSKTMIASKNLKLIIEENSNISPEPKLFHE